MFTGAYNRPMAKGDLTSLKIDRFNRGLNLLDPIEEMDEGYLGPQTVNVLPVGNGNTLSLTDGVTYKAPLTTSATKLPIEIIQYATGLLITYENGMVDRVVQSNAVVTNIAVADIAGAIPPSVVVSQDAALGVYYAYILRYQGSAQSSVKVNLGTLASTSWNGAPAFGSGQPQGQCAISWKTMMIIGQGSRVRWSVLGNPDSFLSNSFIDIKTLDDQSDDIVAFEILGENLLVYKKRSTWMIFDPVSFENRRLYSVGLINRRVTTRVNDRVYWLSHDGVFSTDGGDIRAESGKLGNFNTTPGGNLAYPQISMTSDPMGTVVFHIGGDIFFGYSQFRDFDGNMPWYKCSDASFATIRSIAYSSTYFGPPPGSASAPSDDPANNGLISVNTANDGSNQNFLSTLPKSDGSPNTGQAHLLPPSTSIGVRGTIEIPTLHNKETEGLSRLRRINLYGHGVMGATANAKIELYKNNEVSPVYSATPGTFTTEFLRFRPEIRGRTFKLMLKTDASVGFQLHTIEAEFRTGGR